VWPIQSRQEKKTSPRPEFCISAIQRRIIERHGQLLSIARPGIWSRCFDEEKTRAVKEMTDPLSENRGPTKTTSSGGFLAPWGPNPRRKVGVAPNACGKRIVHFPSRRRVFLLVEGSGNKSGPRHPKQTCPRGGFR